jgi:molybdopterin biosynthesis enzyme
MSSRNATQRITRLTSLPEALALADGMVSAVDAREIATTAAAGRTLAASVMAASDYPARAIAARDGWAVRAEATLDAGGYAPVVLADSPVAVEVGDALPAGFDAVVQVDAVEFRGGVAQVFVTVAAGEGVWPGGADARAGASIVPSGRRITRTDLAVLAAAGIASLRVREPRVRVVSARNDQILTAIVAFICGVIEADGAIALTTQRSPADMAGIEDVLAHDDCDATIVVGGSGAGARDVAVLALARHGEVAFHGLGLAPGETAAFGRVGTRPVLIMPGRLDAALAVWLLFGRRMVARLAARDGDPRGVPTMLRRKVTSTVGLAEMVVVRREDDGVMPIASQSISLQALGNADGWIFVPADAEGFPAGTMVEMRPLP